MDYNKNGHKNKEQLLEHARDTLVKAGWNMGEGRMPPPLGYNDFLKVWDTWIKKVDMLLNSERPVAPRTKTSMHVNEVNFPEYICCL